MIQSIQQSKQTKSPHSPKVCFNDELQQQLPKARIYASQIDEFDGLQLKTLTQIEEGIINSSQSKENIDLVKKRLSKFINFITFHNIQPEEIWKNKSQLTLTLFANILQEKYGYYISSSEFTAFMAFFREQKDRLKPQNFYLFGIWKSHEQDNNEGLNFRYFLQNHKISKPAASTQPLNTSSSNQSLSTFKLSNKTNLMNTVKLAQTNLGQFSNTNKGLGESKTNLRSSGRYSGVFLQAKKYSQSKLQSKVSDLKKDIQQNVLEKKWDFIVMAGQMNQWIQQLSTKKGSNSRKQSDGIPSKQYRFKVINSDPVHLIIQNLVTFEEQPIPQIVFIKKYQTLRKKMVPEATNKNNLKGTVLMVLEQNDKLNKTKLNNRLNQRDQQLNFVLLQIMRMKSMFQWQSKVLNEAQVNC